MSLYATKVKLGKKLKISSGTRKPTEGTVRDAYVYVAPVSSFKVSVLGQSEKIDVTVQMV